VKRTQQFTTDVMNTMLDALTHHRW